MIQRQPNKRDVVLNHKQHWAKQSRQLNVGHPFYCPCYFDLDCLDTKYRDAYHAYQILWHSFSPSDLIVMRKNVQKTGVCCYSRALQYVHNRASWRKALFVVFSTISRYSVKKNSHSSGFCLTGHFFPGDHSVLDRVPRRSLKEVIAGAIFFTGRIFLSSSLLLKQHCPSTGGILTEQTARWCIVGMFCRG